MHLSPFATNAVAIGTSVAAVTDLTTKTEAAREAVAARLQAIYEAAKAATLTANIAIREMMTAGSAIIKQIRAKAEMAGEGIYALAEIPAPLPPSPVGAGPAY